MPAIDDAVIGDRFNEFSVSDNERALIHPVLDLQNWYGLDVWCINHRNQIRFGRKDLRGKNTYLVGLINLANQQFVINGAYQTNTLMNACKAPKASARLNPHQSAVRALVPGVAGPPEARRRSHSSKRRHHRRTNRWQSSASIVADQPTAAGCKAVYQDRYVGSQK